VNDTDEYEHDSEKDNAKDFALWKAYKPEVNTSTWQTAFVHQ
jgi:cysteinyl-tRNA synthetase